MTAVSVDNITSLLLFFFFNDTATNEIYTLSLHDALPISHQRRDADTGPAHPYQRPRLGERSEEHTSELQSRGHLVCRLLLEKKKYKQCSCSSYIQIINRSGSDCFIMCL